MTPASNGARICCYISGRLEGAGFGSMNKLFYTIGFALMFAGGPVSAQVWSGHDYTQTCKGDPGEYEASICATFVISIAQAGKSNGLFCMPPEVTRGQTFTVVDTYIVDHPDASNTAASEMVVASLIKAFPCQAK